jgi:hypothetical protein
MYAIKIIAPSLSCAETEIKACLNCTYLCLDDNLLNWWKVYAYLTHCYLFQQAAFAVHFPVLTCIIHNILAIPGVSISFPSGKSEKINP